LRRVTTGLFDGYDPESFFDEAMCPDGTPRPHYANLVRRLAGFTSHQLAERERVRDAAFRQAGITFTVYGEGEGVERTFPMDLVPRIIPADEWAHLEEGLVQRVTALNRFLDDLYVGDQAVVKDGIIPRWLLTSSDGFQREAYGIAVPHGARCLVAGIDLVRDAEGTYRVLEDNLRNPSGVSYVLENRAAMTRVLPRVFDDHLVRPVDHYGPSLLSALRRVSPAGADPEPTVVVLTPGVFNSAYFEHAFLARQMGVELVEGRDLVVDDHVVSMRTTHGLKRVDVIYRRIDDAFLDPLCFRPDSMLGVPGLMNVYRSGGVAIASAPGAGVADDKAVYTYVPEMIRFYLGEAPILKNVQTWKCADPEDRKYVLDHLKELVVKEVHGSGGYGMLVGPKSTNEQIAAYAERIKADPSDFIAQPTLALSTCPTFEGEDGRLAPRHVDLRPFCLVGREVHLCPGGLTRVALKEGSLVVNSSQGGGVKDTWVLAD